LVDEIVGSREHLENRAVDVARLLAANGPAAYAHTKAAMQRHAVANVLGETPEMLKERNAVFTDADTQVRLMTQVSALTKKKS
jgi:enoyl-CoA hydratase/carnithine racemase